MNGALEAELAELLRQDPMALIRRQQSLFADLVASVGESFVLFGAGHLGNIALTGLRKAGKEPLAFTDNNPKLWNTSVSGLAVFSPEEAVERFGARAVFVVTVFTGSPVLRQLRTMTGAGNVRVMSFANLAWNYPEALLPHGALDLPRAIFEQAADVRKALAVWADDVSCREYVAQIRWRMSPEFGVLPPAEPLQQRYFPDDLFRLEGNETLVDCGAFDGDTIREFLLRQGTTFRQIVAIEPDPINSEQLRHYVAALPVQVRSRIAIITLAAGAQRSRVKFDPTGTPHSMAGQGSIEVESVPLDELLESRTPTFIKMDVEGAEPDVLLGARELIRRHRPILAVCLYHKPEHLWQIPLLIKSLTIRSRLYLRRYSDDCWELIAYAVPAERLAERAMAGEGGAPSKGRARQTNQGEP